MVAPGVVEAAGELQRALVELDAAFCFIGGVAVQRWGEPRFTNDADATVVTCFFDDERITDALLARFSPRIPDARACALRNRVLVLMASNGVGIDVALGALDFEVRAVGRASDWQTRSGIVLRTCSAEDLIVHKAFASRDLDWLDVERVLMRHGRKLNVGQIFAELRPLVELKDDATILPRLEALMRRRDVID